MPSLVEFSVLHFAALSTMVEGRNRSVSESVVDGPRSGRDKPRIVNGRPYDIERYEWYVNFIGSKGTPYCGGILIGMERDLRFIATAAHCFFDETNPIQESELPVKVEFPVNRPQNRNDPDNLMFEVSTLDQLIKPEDQEFSFQQNDRTPQRDDFMLLVLDKPVKGLVPAPLPVGTPNLKNNQDLTVIGFGLTISGDLSSQPEELHGVNIGFRRDSDPLCENEDTITSHPLSMICAGGQTIQDSCNGDSGGPLITGDGVVVGLVSFGPSPCGQIEKPAKYSDVEYALPWFARNIGERTGSGNPVEFPPPAGGTQPTASPSAAPTASTPAPTAPVDPTTTAAPTSDEAANPTEAPTVDTPQPTVRTDAPTQPPRPDNVVTSSCTGSLQRLFVHHPEVVTFAEAREICETRPVTDSDVLVDVRGNSRAARKEDADLYGNLATLRHKGELALMLAQLDQDAIADTERGLVWLGAERQINDPSTATFQWNSEPRLNIETGNFIEWFTNEPHADANERCVATNEFTYNYPCDRKFTFVCEVCGESTVVTSTCPEGQERAFVHHKTLRAWSDAASICQANPLSRSSRVLFSGARSSRSVTSRELSEVTAGNLATVRSKPEKQLLLDQIDASLVAGSENGLIWFGAKRLDPMEDTFVWSSSPQLGMLASNVDMNWWVSEPNGNKPGYPVENCAAINEWGVYDYSCDTQRYTFMCEFCTAVESRTLTDSTDSTDSTPSRGRPSRREDRRRGSRSRRSRGTRGSRARRINEPSSQETASGTNECVIGSISCANFYIVLSVSAVVAVGVVLLLLHVVQKRPSSSPQPSEGKVVA